jgi:hypothetical protein
MDIFDRQVDEFFGFHATGFVVKYIYSQTDGEDDQRSDTCRGIQLLEGMIGQEKCFGIYIII